MSWPSLAVFGLQVASKVAATATATAVADAVAVAECRFQATSLAVIYRYTLGGKKEKKNKAKPSC